MKHLKIPVTSYNGPRTQTCPQGLQMPCIDMRNMQSRLTSGRLPIWNVFTFKCSLGGGDS
jgi:hypothetical protein